MGRRPADSPSEPELEVLDIIWEIEPATVRDVHDVLSKRRKIQITTLTTLMALMVQKGLLKVSDSRRPQRFIAVQDAESTYQPLMQKLADRFFRGSIAEMALHSLFGRKQSAKSKAKIKKFLRELEDDK